MVSTCHYCELSLWHPHRARLGCKRRLLVLDETRDVLVSSNGVHPSSFRAVHIRAAFDEHASGRLLGPFCDARCKWSPPFIVPG